MAQIPLNSGIRRVLNLSLIFVFISAFTLFVMGAATSRVHQDVKFLKFFLEQAEGIQPNFEKSLMVYTEDTKKTIAYIMNLRPETEEDYITFISEIEHIGQKLSLNLRLQSVENISSSSTPPDEKSLNYSVTFFGNEDDVISFLRELETLPYFIKVSNINFSDGTFENLDYKATLPNVHLSLQVFIK